MKVDLKDRKILYYLDIDSRQSFHDIGDKVGLSKNVVNYRVKRLIKNGIIKNFYTSIDFHKLGYTNLAFYVNYQYYTPVKEKEIIDYFVDSKYSWWIANIQGKYDLVVLFLVKNLNDFFDFWKDTLKKYRYHFQETNIAFYPKTYNFHKSYLFDNYSNEERNKFNNIENNEIINLDNKDLYILKLLALDARKPLTEIAKLFNSSPTMIDARINKLRKLGIIQGFRIEIDYSKIGYQLFNVHFKLKNYDKIQTIIDYVRYNPFLVSFHEVIDHCDLSLNFHANNFNELHKIIKDIYMKFPNDIKNHMTFSFPEIYKSNYLPGDLIKEFKKINI